MNTNAIREKLHQMIDDADAEKLSAFLEVFSTVESGSLLWWKDPETIKELDDRLKNHIAEQEPAYTPNNKILDTYFSYLKNLDTKTKKRLILKLTQSLDTSEATVPSKTIHAKDVELNTLFGAWADDQSSDEIITAIKKARVNNTSLESFE